MLLLRLCNQHNIALGVEYRHWSCYLLQGKWELTGLTPKARWEWRRLITAGFTTS